MNAEQLLAHFERVTDTPDAIAGLRRFILDLAVRGSLVPQDQKDEPASELLKRIAAERVRLKLTHNAVPLEPSEVPFALPPGWSWTRVGEVCSKTGSGSTPRGGRNVYKSHGVPFLRSQNIYNDGLRLDDVAYIDQSTHERMAGTAVKPMDLLLNITGGSIGRCCVVPTELGDANVSQHVAILRPAVGAIAPFFHRLVLSPYFQSFVLGEQTGAGRGGLPKNRMDQIPVALPPVAEQQRIVARVDELMEACRQVEAARSRREAARDRLTTGTLTLLSVSDSEPFHKGAQFALEVLPSLTARSHQIRRLRQTILSLAVRGKLVPQDAGDEAAIVFDRSLPDDFAPPFTIPTGWTWSRLRALGRLKGGGTPSKTRDDFWDGTIPWVSPKDMKVDHIVGAQMRITDAAVEGSAVSLIEPSSLLFVVRGMILAHSFPVAVSRVPVTINQDMKALVLKIPAMAEYLVRALKGLKPQMLALVQRSSHGTCRIEGSDYSDFLVPIPPLAEQHRIVAKVDQLMELCDRLETLLARAEIDRSRLLEALLHDAIHGPGRGESDHRSGSVELANVGASITS